MLYSALPEAIDGEETVARFLTSSSHYSAANRLVKGVAFMPESGARETSVFRHAGSPVDELQALGITHVAAAVTGRRLHGAALITAAAVRRCGLDTICAEPPPRHAAIRGWPWTESDPELRKGRHKEIANDLASAAGAPVLFPL